MTSQVSASIDDIDARAEYIPKAQYGKTLKTTTTM